MRDSVELFEKTLEEYTTNKNLQNHLMELIVSLYKDLECERTTNENFQKQIQNLTKQDTFGMTSRFVSLKAEYATLKQKLATLKNENDDLNIQLIAKSEEAKQLVSEKEQELKNYYMVQMKQKNEEIKRKEQAVEDSKQNLKKKEQELYTEVQAIEASSALELNQMDSSFKRQLGESNKKLKDSMETCNVLRIELMSVKEQFVEYKHTSNQKIAQLQKRLRESYISENSSFLMERPQEQSWNCSASGSGSLDENCTKYQSLEISYQNFTNSDNRPINLKKTADCRSPAKSVCEKPNRVSIKDPLPPLIQCNANTKNYKPISKRRKLFNPDDLTYLNDVDVTEKRK